MAHMSTAVLRHDATMRKELSDQIQSNQASFEPGQNFASNIHLPTKFRCGHPRPKATVHPIDQMQPPFEAPYDSPALVPARRLYVRLLVQALPIFHTLIHRMPELLRRKSTSNPLQSVYPEPHKVLTKAQTEHTLEFMGRIGSKVNWAVEDMDKAWGITTRRSDRSLRADGMFGWASTIATSQAMIERLEAGAKSGEKKCQNWFSFQLAATWLHEAAHAVENAVMLEDNAIVFFGQGPRTSELGFEVEARILGGCFDTTSSDTGRSKTRAVLWESPDFELRWCYRHEDSAIAVRGLDEEMSRKWSVSWDVPWSHFETLLDETYWEYGLTPARGVLMRPEAKVGTLIVPGTPMTKAEHDLMTAVLARRGFAVEEDNRVVRM